MVAMEAATPPPEHTLGATGKPAPRKKILVRKVKPKGGTEGPAEDVIGTKTRTSTRDGSTVDFVGGLATRAPTSAPLPPSRPHPASEAAIAPRGPALGPNGKRTEWDVLGDVGEEHVMCLPAQPRSAQRRSPNWGCLCFPPFFTPSGARSEWWCLGAGYREDATRDRARVPPRVRLIRRLDAMVSPRR